MWSRTVGRYFYQRNKQWKSLEQIRSVKTFIRTPRRILMGKEMEKEQRPKTKTVIYESRDLVSDQASRAALAKLKDAQLESTSGSVMEMGLDEEESMKGQRVRRLDKLDKTTNMNFVQLLANLRTKSYRDKTNQILLEGKRLIMDGLLAGCKLRTLVYCHPKEIEHLPIVEGEGQRILIDKARMAIWSLLDAPPGIMAVVERPDVETLMDDNVKSGRIPLTIVVDGVRRPDNMGAIIRSAAAAGCQRLLLMKGTCDPWEEKVLRAGMGGHFRIPIFTGLQWPRMINYLPDNFRVFLADCNSFEVIKEAASYLDDVKDDALLLDSGDDESDRFGTGMEEVEMVRHDDGTVLRIEPELRRPSASPLKQHTLPIFQYHEPSYFGHSDENRHCVLIIGGETSSLSPAAYQFAHMHSGCKVHISMCNAINSLTVSTALGVVAFEIQRQYRQQSPAKQTVAIEGDVEVQKVEAEKVKGLATGIESR